MKPICLKLTRATTVLKRGEKDEATHENQIKKSRKVTKKKLIRNFALHVGVIDETAPPFTFPD